MLTALLTSKSISYFLQGMNAGSQCECQQSGASCLSCLNQYVDLAEPFMPNQTSPMISQQSQPNMPFGLGQPTNGMQPYSPFETDHVVPPWMSNATYNDHQHEQAPADPFSSRFSPTLQSPASSTRVTATSSWEELADLDSQRHITPLSEDDSSTTQAKSEKTINQHSSNIRHSSYPTTPLSAQKTPESLGSEQQAYFDVSSPASENSSPTSLQSLSLTVPKQNIQRVNKRRQLTVDERKNAKTVRKVGACVRCRVFKLKVSFWSNPFTSSNPYLFGCSVMVATHAPAASTTSTARGIFSSRVIETILRRPGWFGMV